MKNNFKSKILLFFMVISCIIMVGLASMQQIGSMPAGIMSDIIISPLEPNGIGQEGQGANQNDDNEAPVLTFGQMGGEVLNTAGTKVSVTATDSDGIAYIKYHWDYHINGNEPQVASYNEIRNTQTLEIATPTDLGLHILRVCAIDQEGKQSYWSLVPYYVVTQYSATVDSTTPEFNTEDPDNFPLSGSDIELEQNILLRATDNESGVYYIAYAWSKEGDPKPAAEDYTLVYQPVNGANVTAPNETGTWYLRYYAANSVYGGSYFNRSKIKYRRYNVNDTIAPTIALNGEENIDVALNGTFVDPGATVTDNYDAERTIYSNDVVDTTRVGTYTLTYQATDAGGNQSEVLRRYVTVVGTSTTYELTTPSKITYLYGQDLDLTGATIKVTSPRGVVSYVDPTAEMFDGFTTTQLGLNSCTFTYEGVSETYNYNVLDSVVGRALIPPTKVTYEYNEDLNLAGAKIAKVMASGAQVVEADVDESMLLDAYDKTTIGEQTLRVQYEEDILNLVITVTKANIDMENVLFDDGTFTYDGTTKSIEVNADTLPVGVNVSSYDGNEKIDVGTYTITAHFSVTDSDHYNVPEDIEATLTINPKELTVTAQNKTKTYGTANPILTTTIAGNIPGETPAFTGSMTVETTETTDVGTYDITRGTLALADYELGNFKAANYSMTFVPGVLTINAKDISELSETAALDTLTYEYDGTAKEPTATITYGTLTLTAGTDYTIAYANNVNVGTATQENGPTATITGTGNYTGTINKTFAITTRAITITAVSAEREYNGIALANANATITVGSLAQDHTISATVTGTITNVGTSTNTVTAVVIKDADENDVTGNYNVTLVSGTLTVTPKELTVTADNKTKTYGEVNPELTKTVTGFVLGETAGFTGELTTTATQYSAEGTYPITSNELALADNQEGNFLAANYSMTFVPGTLTIGKKDISEEDVTKALNTLTYEYDGTAKEPTATVTYGTLTLTAGADYTITYANNVNVGTATQEDGPTATITGIGNYTGSVSIPFAITPINITVTAASDSKTYDGTALTNSGYTLTGTLASGEAETVVVTGTQTNAGSSANTVTSVIVKDADENDVTGNYNVTLVEGILTVNPKDISELSETAALDTLTYEYDGTAKEPTATITYGTLTLTAGTDYTITYTNNINVGIATGENAPTATITGIGNYTGSVNKTFEITSKDITITAASDSKTYDGTALTNSEYTLTGTLIAGQTETVVVTGTQTNAGSSANTVTSVIIKDTDENDVTGNYNVTLVEGLLTINPATLTVTAAPKTKTYGEANPRFTKNYSGAITGETPKFTGDMETTATQNSNVGTYPITQGTLALVDNGTFIANNYEMNFVGANLTIEAKALNEDEIALSQETITYTGEGIEPEVIAYDGETALTLNADYEVEYTNNINVGTATQENAPTVTITGIGNYTGTVNKTFAITARPITVTAASDSRIYNGTALVNSGVTIATGTLATGEELETTVTGTITDVGTVTNTLADVKVKNATGYTTSNYDITSVNGLLTVTPKTITVTAAIAEKTFGQEDPALTYVNSGVIDGETAGFTGTLTREAGEAVGEYNILQGTLALADNQEGNFLAANYTLSYTGAKFKINPKEVFTVTVSGGPYTYDGTAKTPTVTVKDEETTLTLNEDYTLDYDDNVNAGTVTITITGIGNYDVTTTRQFTIAKRTLNVTPIEPLSKTYGEADPALDYDYSNNLEGQIPAFTGNIARDAGEDVGTYTIRKSSLGISDNDSFIASNYEINFTEANFEINEKSVNGFTVILSGDSYTYDGTAKAPTAIVKDVDNVLTLGTDYTLDYGDNVNAGTKTVTVTGIGNYKDTTSASFVIAKKVLTVTANEQTKVFGEADPELTYENTGAITGETSRFEGELSREPGEAKGEYNILQGTLVLADNGNFKANNYEIAYTGAKLTITGKDISGFIATLSPESYTYDGTAKTPIVTVKDGETTLTLDADYEVTYTNNVDAGTAKATITGIGNYSNTIEREFTINKRTLMVRADAKTRIYGVANPELTYTYSNNVTGEIPVFTGNIATSATITSPEGEYNITRGTLDIADNGTFKVDNYQMSYVSAKLTIEKKNISELDVSLAGTEYTYNAQAIEPEVTITNGNVTLIENIDYEVEYTNNINAGTANVAITCKGNYEGTTNKTFEIKKVNLTVTAASEEKVYDGTKLENNTVTLTSGTVVTGQTLTISATGEITNAGEVTNEVTTAIVKDNQNVDVTANYNITKVNGKLTVTPKELTVTAIANSKIYDEEDPELEYNYSGNLVGETPEFTGNIARENGENHGTYKIQKGTLTLADNAEGNFIADNYEMNFVEANFVINVKNLSAFELTLNKTTFTYAGQNITPIETVKDGAKTLVKDTDYEVSYTGNKDVGTATLTITGIENYEGTISTEFTISKRKVIVTADDKTKTYGEEIPELTYTYANAANGEVPGFTGNIEVVATANSNVGEYDITQGTLNIVNNGTFKVSNYEMEYVDGLLTIVKATYDMSGVTFENAEYTYDGNEQSILINEAELPEGVRVASYDGNGQIHGGIYDITVYFEVDDEVNYVVPSPMTAIMKIEEKDGPAIAYMENGAKLLVESKEYYKYLTIVFEGEGTLKDLDTNTERSFGSGELLTDGRYELKAVLNGIPTVVRFSINTKTPDVTATVASGKTKILKDNSLCKGVTTITFGEDIVIAKLWNEDTGELISEDVDEIRGYTFNTAGAYTIYVESANGKSKTITSFIVYNV